MKATNRKRGVSLVLAAAFAAAGAAAAFSALGAAETSYAAEEYTYNELYRDQLSFSPAKNWNNDPNGLLYVPNADGTGGTYHMYYQYNPNGKGWGDMSWGHATSTDLVHWEEQEVAIPAYQDVDGVHYDMMFSGSAVYDVNNTSGLFDETEGGALQAGQGIVAILTQPSDAAGGQRQILAYSKDNGAHFTIYGEILGADDDGGKGDGEFRDPKVFWEPTLQKWLMAVGGGAVRMYASDNLTEWEYLGETGYWGECPDLSAFSVNGETKYVLILSPEDKENSHRYNGTTREDAYYPAEYYVVGSLDEDGMFVGETPLTRLSQGIDSYAFQSFNNAPDGKVYGVSWSASWKTVGDYESLRENFNGGMTVVCELGLREENGKYVLTRYPVAALDTLRGEKIASYHDTLPAGENALRDARAAVADFEIVLDFSAGATKAKLALRTSSAERLVITYDADTSLLTLDRSQSSLAMTDGTLFAVPYTQTVPLQEGKLTLRILLDRASVSLFANGGTVSFFSAFFPSVSSQGMSLTADGDLGVEADVYAMDSIFPAAPENNNLYLSTNKIDGNVGSTYTVSASMLADGFTNDRAEYTVTEGADILTLEKGADATKITLNAVGSARIQVSAGGQSKTIEVYSYENGFVSDLAYPMRWGGFRYTRGDGLFFSTGTSDAFLFSDTTARDFVYTASFTPADEGETAQAAALVFGAAENYTGYYVVTADRTANLLKLWRAGTGDLFVTHYHFPTGTVALRAVMSDGTLRVYVNGAAAPALTYTIEDYAGGRLGLNVYNGAFLVNNVGFAPLDEGEGGGFAIGETEIQSILNVTDGYAVLSENDYTYADGVLTIAESYLKTLPGEQVYTFKVNTAQGAFYVQKETTFRAYSVSMQTATAEPGQALTLMLGTDTAIERVLIDGTEVAFTQDGRTLLLGADATASLAEGDHVITVYGDSGRAELFVPFRLPDLTAQNNSKAASTAVLVIVLVLLAGGAGGYVWIMRPRRASEPDPAPDDASDGGGMSDDTPLA